MEREALSKEAAKRVEAALYGYKENRARLDTLRLELAELKPGASVNAQQYDITSRSGGGVSDPVADSLERYEAQKARLEGEITRLERWTAPVDRLLTDMSAEWVLEGSKLHGLKKILEMWYFSGLSWVEVAAEFNLSKRAVYHRRGELLAKAAGYLGL